MGRPCTVCKHPDRAAIESEAIAGTVRGTALEWSVGESSLRRHLFSHPLKADELQVDTVVAKIYEGLERMEALEARLAQMLAQAQSTGDTRTAMQAVSGFTRARAEVRANLTLLARLRERSASDGVRDAMASSAWITIKAVIDDALVAFPEARAEVARRLREVSDASL